MRISDWSLDVCSSDLVAAVDVVPDLETHVIRVDGAGNGLDDLIVPDQEFEMNLRRKLEAVHDLPMPVGGPAFVHDLRFDLRNEIPGLLVRDREDVLLPHAQARIVVADDEEQIILRLQRSEERRVGKACGSP